MIQTYFISDGYFIKIGKSAQLVTRLAALQASFPRPLLLLCILPGDREYELHQRFKAYRKNGEWFFPVYEIYQFIFNHGGSVQHGKTALPFRIWLRSQLEEESDIGELARAAEADPHFPDSATLGVLLNYLDSRPELRRIAKLAHAAWRQELKFYNIDFHRKKFSSYAPRLIKGGR